MKCHWKLHLSAVVGHPVLYDEGVEACRNACVGGASIASAAMTIAAYCDNPFTGLPALRECLERLVALPFDPEAWQSGLGCPLSAVADEAEFPPGFGYIDDRAAAFIVAACARVAARCGCASAPARAKFYLRHRDHFECRLGPLNSLGLAALVFADHGVSIEEAERLYLSWRMRPAIVEAQRARRVGIGGFPFASERFEYDGAWPQRRVRSLSDLEREVGLD